MNIYKFQQDFIVSMNINHSENPYESQKTKLRTRSQNNIQKMKSSLSHEDDGMDFGQEGEPESLGMVKKVMDEEYKQISHDSQLIVQSLMYSDAIRESHVEEESKNNSFSDESEEFNMSVNLWEAII